MDRERAWACLTFMISILIYRHRQCPPPPMRYCCCHFGFVSMHNSNSTAICYCKHSLAQALLIKSLKGFIMKFDQICYNNPEWWRETMKASSTQILPYKTTNERMNERMKKGETTWNELNFILYFTRVLMVSRHMLFFQFIVSHAIHISWYHFRWTEFNKKCQLRNSCAKCWFNLPNIRPTNRPDDRMNIYIIRKCI